MVSTEGCCWREKRESGAALVLALILLTLGSLLVLPLASEANVNLVDTTRLQAGRELAYAADGALDGAVQQTRYHGSCESYPKSGSLQLSSAVFVYVACAGTPMTSLSVVTGMFTVTASSPIFIPEDIGQPVFDKSLVNGTTVATYIDSMHVTFSDPTNTAASGTDSNAILGVAGQRLDVFWACVDTSPIASCSASSAAATAVVNFGDTDSNGNAGAYGFNADIEYWTVKQADS